MNLPPKSTFRFSELPAITGIKPYVLRFWETEFEEIVPLTDEAGEKHYSRADVEMILQIKSLLFDEKLSINEAKGRLRVQDQSFVQDMAAAMSDDHMTPIMEALQLIREVKQKHHW